jgi:hypothetical protein
MNPKGSVDLQITGEYFTIPKDYSSCFRSSWWTPLTLYRYNRPDGLCFYLIDDGLPFMYDCNLIPLALESDPGFIYWEGFMQAIWKTGHTNSDGSLGYSVVMGRHERKTIEVIFSCFRRDMLVLGGYYRVWMTFEALPSTLIFQHVSRPCNMFRTRIPKMHLQLSVK